MGEKPSGTSTYIYVRSLSHLFHFRSRGEGIAGAAQIWRSGHARELRLKAGTFPSECSRREYNEP